MKLPERFRIRKNTNKLKIKKEEKWRLRITLLVALIKYFILDGIAKRNLLVGPLFGFQKLLPTILYKNFGVIISSYSFSVFLLLFFLLIAIFFLSL
ncbi:MAG: hypothetical protein KAI67_03980 [Candidatus Pacebacteria bacterium]|nr:hypothetical protein [Candidatus Paceibacterota bacterium]